ncbi:MAG TPA: BTAD domain-containing putative transcriptional regulator [Acidimicrobiales bacterium]|nr:BTAD domain-containing putative transcriptional regulator [Acidimicrobiales bacterium]
MARRADTSQPAQADHAAPLDDEIVRPRLVERLALRWAVPVVLIEAPGGFGKSIALAQAHRHNLADPRGIDLHLACRGPERDPVLLAGRILGLLDAPLAPTPEEPAELAGLVAAALARQAPTPVALTLDDVHHLADGDGAVALLAALIRSLPTNAHLVLSGRRMPSLPLSRLSAADQVVRITQRDLAFEPDETAALAAQHGIDPDALDLSAGWPALTRLALVVGRTASIDYLIEEVVHGLDHETLTALAATVLGRRVDDDMLREVARTPITTGDLLATVPLVSSAGGGQIRAHDLWAEALDGLLEPDELHGLAVAISGWHLAHGRHEEAIEAAAAAGAWAHARRAVLAAIGPGDAELRASRTAKWLAAFPPDQHDEPELLLLRGITVRMSGDLVGSRPLVDLALERFGAQGNPDGQAAAALEAGLTAWLLGDLGRVLELVALGERLLAEGTQAMRWMVEMAHAGVADLGGDTAGALARLERIDVVGHGVPDAAAQVVLRWMSTLTMLAGDSERSVAIADALLRRDDADEMVRLAAGIARWQHGDPEPFRGDVTAAGVAHLENARDDFQVAVYRAVIDASLGLALDVSTIHELATDRGRDQAFVAVGRAASLVAAGDEPAASAVLDALVDAGGLDDLPCRGELRRFVSLCLPLSERIAAALATDDLGPKLAERRALGQLVVAARRGDEVDWTALPSPPDVLTGLPLRWSLELAARAAGAAAPMATALAQYLIDFAGPPALDLLRELRDVPALTAGVDEILATVPSLPGHELRITACGPLQVEGSERLDPEPLRRARVRELLALLVLRDRVSAAQAVELLWPGLDPDRGRNNLRITLSYVRQLLEPDRVKGQPSFHVRRDGDHLWLERSRYLDVDIWHVREALARARALESAGRIADAMVEYQSAVARWTGEVLVDLRDHHHLAPEVTYLDLELEEATARVAEWALAQGDDRAAEAVAERLLVHDPYAERAHAVIIGARLARREMAAAGEAVARCREALAELGVEPGPSTAMLLRRLDQLTRPGRA